MTVSNRAVPLWFMLARRHGSTNRDAPGGTPSSSSAHFMAVGSVAAGGTGMNAVTMDFPAPD